MKIHELLRERAELPHQQALRQRMRESTQSREDDFFWREFDEVYKVFSYYWHAPDKTQILQQIAHCVMDVMPEMPRSPLGILDIGTGKGDKINDIMAMLLSKRRQLAVLDMVEPSAAARENAGQLLSRHEYGGCLRDSFGTLEEIGERAYDAIIANNSIYYLEPFEENIIRCMEKIKQSGVFIILYLANNNDYGSLIRDICEKSGVPHKITFSLLPLRLFMGKDKESYNSRMVELLKYFYLQKHHDSFPSDREFLEIIETCSHDGFLHMEYCLFVVRKM
uniref:Methyltransferase domain-containing protein n=1 Tax=Candidatus Kentrum sp. MB TaxID=2138164 RepID=A0A451B9X6_9GAMM|nr:MAG: hypothetical protein BECKMB1821G_GA0114241_101616 [Candidatus Kentron sp. MB]VFK27174.1 MAG: hypothetical protein BECKMB1821I_GA0114274_100267 [Candidatus Kentron sp. MB]VFK75079.1 MAG: hypothetical protein BECKMB1821H_GA0114242_101516 [Candidatus Kentron sp. MB]